MNAARLLDGEVGAQAVSDPTFLSVLRLLAASPKLSQREVASIVGVSLGKANHCLRALISLGILKAENYRNSRNKVSYLYQLTPLGVAAKVELSRRVLERRRREFAALRQEIAWLRLEVRMPVSVVAEPGRRGRPSAESAV